MSCKIRMTYLGTCYLSAEQLKSDVGYGHLFDKYGCSKVDSFQKATGNIGATLEVSRKEEKWEKSRRAANTSFVQGWKSSRIAL